MGKSGHPAGKGRGVGKSGLGNNPLGNNTLGNNPLGKGCRFNGIVQNARQELPGAGHILDLALDLEQLMKNRFLKKWTGYVF